MNVGETETMTSKTKKTKPKTAATVASVTARHGASTKTASTGAARAQGVSAYRRLVDEPVETPQAEQKRKASGSFRDRAAAVCRYPVVKNLRQASAKVREATQAVVDTARGAAIHLWKRYAPDA